MTGNFEGDIIMNQADKDAIAHQVGMTAANKVSFDMGESGTGIGKEVATAKANPTGSSNAAGAASGVFREDIDRDIRAAMMEMESVAATARACQAFVRSVQQ